MREKGGTFTQVDNLLNHVRRLARVPLQEGGDWGGGQGLTLGNVGKRPLRL